VAKQRPTHLSDLQTGVLSHVFVRPPVPSSIHTLEMTRTSLKKLTAACLAFSLCWFSSMPQALGQSSAAADVPQTAAASKPSLPAPNAKQSARAQDFFHKGTAALRANNSQRAMKLFAAAHRLDPANGTYIAAFEIARQQQIGELVNLAKQDQKQGHTAQAQQQLKAAASLDPDNPLVTEHALSLATEEPAVVESNPMPEFSTGLVELSPRQTRATFHLRDRGQQLVKQVLIAYGITAILDDSVPDKVVRVDLTNVPFSEASSAIQLSTGTFMVPLDAEHVLVAKDTKANRTKFQRLLLETVFLPGLDTKEMQESVNMVKTVFGVKQVSAHPSTGALSIRAPEAILHAVNTTLARLYLDKPEIILDVRVYQVNDSRQEDLGVAFPQSLNVFNVSSQLTSIINSNQATIAQLVAAGLVNPGDLAGIAALLVGLGLVNGSVLNQPFALFGNGLTLSGLSFGGTTVNASLNISNTRELDHVQLRAGDSEKQSILIGSKYPVVTQSYSSGTQTPTGSTSLASLIGGASQANTSAVNPLSYAPSVQYLDLGLTVKVEPRVVMGNDVQMKLQVKIASLAGASVNGSPIINNRSFTTAIQVPDGGSALIASSVSQTESKSLTGIPGLSELPGFQWTASPTTQLMIGKLLIVISPRIVSATHTSVATQMLRLPLNSSTQ
jgi:general secretion pathway protein D